MSNTSHRKLVAIGLGVFGLIGVTAACATVADLEDVNYNPSSDASTTFDRQQVRESSVEKPDVEGPTTPLSVEGLPCEGGIASGDGGPEIPACDQASGNGCCLRKDTQVCVPNNATAINDLCGPAQGPTVFVACRQSDNDNACCWLSTGSTFVARFKGECDGGTMACLDNSGCASGICKTTTCTSTSDGHTFVIGECVSDLGATPTVTCPQ